MPFPLPDCVFESEPACLGRRAFLLGAGACVLLPGCGTTVHRDRRRRRRATPVAAQHYVSRPDLRPPQIAITKRPGDAESSDRFVFTDAHGGNSQQGPLIVDRTGRLVWFKPVSEHGALHQRVFNVRVQRYRGEPVLTWWQGAIVGAHGRGHYEIYDRRYRRVAEVRAGNGYRGDLHEFRITERGTALLTSYGTAVGQIPRHDGRGTRRGAYLYGVVQEVDVASGRVLMQWRSDDHVPVSASMHLPPPADPQVPWDYFHVNSVAVDPTDGHLIISGRNVWACYKVDRRTGEVIWSLGGRESSFAQSTQARFAFQHHVVPHGDGRITIFDNESGPPDHARQSRGIVLELDHGARRAVLLGDYHHHPSLLSPALGSMQALDGGGMFIGWGDSATFTEYDAQGHVVLDARLADGVASYRAFQDPWEGRPVHRPRIAARRRGRAAELYASWNGATVHRRWRVLGGPSETALAELRTAEVGGFETRIALSRAPAWVAAEALDGAGQPLARSLPVRV